MNIKTSALVAGLIGFALLAPELAMADTIGQIANRLNMSIQDVGKFAGALGYAISFFLLLGAILKFKQYGDDAERNSLRTPIFLLICAVLGVYMTSVLVTGKDSIFGSGATSQGYDGSGFTNVR